MAGFWIVVDNANYCVAKEAIVWYIYPYLVGENLGSNIQFITRVSLLFADSLQIININNWSANDPALHVSNERFHSLHCVDFVWEVIV